MTITHRAHGLGKKLVNGAPLLPRFIYQSSEGWIHPREMAFGAALVNDWLTLRAQPCAHNYLRGTAL